MDNSNENLKKTGNPVLTSIIEITLNDIENSILPINPLEETRVIDLTIKYRYQSGSFLSKLFLRLLKGRKIDINFKIESYPSEWSTVTMTSDKISSTFPINPFESLDFIQNVLIQVNDKAPAFKKRYIKINVSTPDIKGKFGIITLIKGFENTIEIPIMASYVPRLTILSNQNYKLTPYNNTIIPIDITNNGNGRTRVFTEIENLSENWVATINDTVIIDPNMSDTVFLNIKTDNKYKNEVVILKFTPAYSEDLLIKGETQTLALSIENDGSYIKKKSGLGIELITVIIAIIIIFLIIVFFVYLYKKK